MSTPPRVSVVVLSKDEPELHKSLVLLQPQVEALQGEVVVIDASEGRLDWIREAHQWVRWIDYQGPFWRPSTIPHQRNAGVRASRAPVIAFCDAGGEPDANWLATLCAPLFDQTYQLVAGPITSTRPGVYKVVNPGANGEILNSPATANVAFTRTLFDEVNGFDERFLYGSDVDFSWRCAKAHQPCRVVADAMMYMDWGPTSVSRKRSWRYGAAWIRLFRYHPERRLYAVKERPERVVYPLWIVGACLSLPLILSSQWFWAPLAWWALLGLLFIRNLKQPHPARVIEDHLIGAVAEISEVARHALGEIGPIAFVPGNDSFYTRTLAQELATQGVAVSTITRPTASHTINIILAPLSLVLARLRGVRVIHLHWTYWFVPAHLAKVPGGRYFLRQWLLVWLWTLHAVGLRLVWTVHNALPHELTFDDDEAVRDTLLRHADQVVLLQEPTAGIDDSLTQVPPLTITHGPVDLPTPSASRSELRMSRGVASDQTMFTLAGQLRPYKGADIAIAAASQVGSQAKVCVVGAALGDTSELEYLAATHNARGADVTLDNRHVAEAELADILAASDFGLFPFKSITNSGSVLMALSAGLPVVIPDLPGLAEIPSTCAIRYESSLGPSGLADAMVRAIALTDAERVHMARAAREFAHRITWDEVARRYVNAYRAALRRPTTSKSLRPSSTSTGRSTR